MISCHVTIVGIFLLHKRQDFNNYPPKNCEYRNNQSYAIHDSPIIILLVFPVHSWIVKRSITNFDVLITCYHFNAFMLF